MESFLGLIQCLMLAREVMGDVEEGEGSPGDWLFMILEDDRGRTGE